MSDKTKIVTKLCNRNFVSFILCDDLVIRQIYISTRGKNISDNLYLVLHKLFVTFWLLDKTSCQMSYNKDSD